MHDVREVVRRRRREHTFAAARNPPLLVGALAALDAALFTAIGTLHLGVTFGGVSAPKAHWVAPIELFGALCCLISAGSIFTRASLAREIAWIANGIALWCVILGIFAFSTGLDPCTPITDIHYSLTAAAIFVSIWRMSRWQRGLSWPP